MSGNILFFGNKIFEIPPFFQTRPGDLGKKVHACSLRFSALNIGKHMLGLSLFRPSRQSNISTSGEERFKYPWENKISQMPYPRANKNNQIPIPCPASPPPADFTLTGALRGGRKAPINVNPVRGGVRARGGDLTNFKNFLSNSPGWETKGQSKVSKKPPPQGKKSKQTIL